MFSIRLLMTPLSPKLIDVLVIIINDKEKQHKYKKWESEAGLWF